jgi:hypothetical protein
MTADKLTATITPRWWFKPAMYSACFIAAVIGMSDQRFEKMVKPIITHGVKLRVM